MMKPDRATQLTENGLAVSVLFGGAEIGTLPINYGVRGARRDVRLHNSIDSGARDVCRSSYMSEYIYQH